MTIMASGMVSRIERRCASRATRWLCSSAEGLREATGAIGPNPPKARGGSSNFRSGGKRPLFLWMRAEPFPGRRLLVRREVPHLDSDQGIDDRDPRAQPG